MMFLWKRQWPLVTLFSYDWKSPRLSSTYQGHSEEVLCKCHRWCLPEDPLSFRQLTCPELPYMGRGCLSGHGLKTTLKVTWGKEFINHYNDVILGEMVYQITSLTIVHLTGYSGADQRKHQSSASLAFVRGIHRWPVNSPHKWPVTQKMFPFKGDICAMYKDNNKSLTSGENSSLLCETYTATFV